MRSALLAAFVSWASANPIIFTIKAIAKVVKEKVEEVTGGGSERTVERVTVSDDGSKKTTHYSDGSRSTRNAAPGTFSQSEAVEMALGGIVTGPTNAMIGEAGDEAVIPLDQLGRMIGAGAGGGMTVVFNDAVYGFEDFEDKINQAWHERERRGRIG